MLLYAAKRTFLNVYPVSPTPDTLFFSPTACYVPLISFKYGCIELFLFQSNQDCLNPSVKIYLKLQSRFITDYINAEFRFEKKNNATK